MTEPARRKKYEKSPTQFSPTMRRSRTVPALADDVIESGWGRITERQWCANEIERLRRKGVETALIEENGYVAVA